MLLIIHIAERTYFKTPFAELGQSPEGCSSFVFPKIMGKELAQEVLWGSKKLSAEEALQAKFVHEIHPAGELDSAALRYTQKLVDNVPVEQVAQLHWPVREALVAKLHQVNQEELDVLQKKWVSKECFLALAAFLESRKLNFAAFVLRLI